MKDEIAEEIERAFAHGRAAGPGQGTAVPSEIHGEAASLLARAERLEREQRRALARGFVTVARSAELAEPGAFATLDLGGAPIAVVRGDEGLHGFVNACVHRGACILREPRGVAKRIVCPYHGLAYDRTGALAGAPLQETFAPPIAEGSARLAPIEVAEAYGWVWARVEPGGASTGLEAALGAELIDELEEWPLAELTVVDAVEFPCEFDWKIGVEAFLEPLHVPSIHARSAHPMVDVRGMAARRLGPHSRMALPFRVPRVFEADGLIGAEAARFGVLPFERLRDVQRKAHFVYFVYPAVVWMLFPSHVLALRFLPAGVGRTTLRYELLAAPALDDAGRSWRDSLRPGYRRLLEEDLENLPWIERGLASGRLEALPLSSLERRIGWFREQLRGDLER